MALDVRSRRFGFAIFEGPNELLDYGVRGFRTRVEKVQVPPRQKLATLFDDFNVAIVVWRGPASCTSRQKASIGDALQRESRVTHQSGRCTMKVRELIEALSKRDPEHDVVVWLPGSRIDLARVFNFTMPNPLRKEVLIEGSIRHGSVLS